MIHRLILFAALVLIGLATACSPAPTPTPTVTLVAVAPDTVTPQPTETPTATATATVQPSATPTVTPSATPSATPTTTPTSTPQPSPTATRTKKPTQPPASATPTVEPVSNSAMIPAPFTKPFSPDLFIQMLDNGHAAFIKFLAYHGKVSSGNISIGSCYKFFNIRDEWKNLLVLSDVPEAWAALYTEYSALRNQVFVVTDPINQICGAGRGTLSAETDQQILNFLDSAQNRLYQLSQQAQAMK